MTKPSVTPHRRSLLTVAGLSALVVVGAAACGGSSSGGSADAVSPSAATTAGAAGGATSATVGTSSDGGTHLVDASGRTLYLFEADKTSKSTCTGACATAWPPATVTGTPKATGAAKAGLLGTTTRADGSTQLTYAGHPLYRFSGDGAPGDMNGAGSAAFGAEWYPVTPAGATLEGQESDSESGSSPSPSSSSDSSGYSYSY